MVVREATSYSREQVRHTAVLLRERLANQLRGLEAMLERAQAEASQPIDETTVSHSDREVLNRYRQKVLSITFNGDDR